MSYGDCTPEKLFRADWLIDMMAPYLGNMALPAEFFHHLNEHYIGMVPVEKMAGRPAEFAHKKNAMRIPVDRKKRVRVATRPRKRYAP